MTKRLGPSITTTQFSLTLIYVAELKKKRTNSTFYICVASWLFFVFCFFLQWFARVPEDNLGLRSEVFLRFLSVNPWINLSSLRFVMTLEEKIGTNTQLQEQQCLTEDVQMRWAAFR